MNSLKTSLRYLSKLSVLFILILGFISVINTEKLNFTECRDFGFSNNELLCSSCREMKEFEKLSALSKECLKCCVEDKEDETLERYAKVVLEVCDCNLGRFPQIEVFVRENQKKSKYKGLSIKQVRGKLPTLVLYNKYDEEEKTMGVENWNTDTLVEYVSQVLGHKNK